MEAPPDQQKTENKNTISSIFSLSRFRQTIWEQLQIVFVLDNKNIVALKNL